MATSERSETTTGRLLAVFARRRWIWLPFLFITPLYVFIGVRADPPEYKATAEVYLNRQNMLFAGIGDPTVWEPVRAILSQITLASRPAIGWMVADALDSDLDGGAIAARTSVDELFGADLLGFTTTDTDPERAAAIATEYARQYIVLRREFDTASLARTTAALTKELRRLEAAGDRTSAVYQSLRETERRLETAAKLQQGNAVLARPADPGTRVGPHPFREAFEALFLALVAGLGIAYLVDTFDRRLRTSRDVADALRLPLLATVPLARRPLLRRHLQTLQAAAAPEEEVEAIRQLRTNLQFASGGRELRVILFSSIGTSRAKPDVAARLALSLARGGQRVMIVDLDFRTPTLHRLFGVAAAPGASDYLEGNVGLKEAMSAVVVEPRAQTMSLRPESEAAMERGSLAVMPVGAAPRDAAELFFGDRLAGTLDTLAKVADVVFLEGSPLLTSGDVPALARLADGVVLVAPRGALTGGIAHEASRLLGQVSTPVIGVVVTERAQRTSDRSARRETAPEPHPA